MTGETIRHLFFVGELRNLYFTHCTICAYVR